VTVQYDAASAPPCSGGEQIGLIRLRDYTRSRWDQVSDVTDDIVDLGIYSCRFARDGGTWSVHADGRAWDSRWKNRAEQQEFFDFLIANSEKLQIQRIIDYSAQRIWDSGRGWYSASPSSPGNIGGTPCHVERNWQGARDPRTIQQIVGSTSAPKPKGGAMGMCAHPAGGYYIFATDGGVFTFGAAAHHFYGSMGGKSLKKPVSGMAVMPKGDGYMLCGQDGGVFAFGSANKLFAGSLAGKKLAAPIVDIEITNDGKGYWMVGQDGGIFTFGKAPFEGSAVGQVKYP
jgi:hypothetical protein